MKPTDAELAILRVLWSKGPSTVREVFEALDDKNVRYTTILKQLQVMFDKGFVSRDDSDKSHVYMATLEEAATQATLLDHLLESAFGGSHSKLFLRALSNKKVSKKELSEIRKLLSELGD